MVVTHIFKKTYSLALSPGTPRLRRYYSWSKESRKIYEYYFAKHDTRGRLTNIYASHRGQIEWYKVSYDDDHNVTFYEDFRGNYWSVEWGTDFIFHMGITSMFDLEQAYHRVMDLRTRFSMSEAEKKKLIIKLSLLNNQEIDIHQKIKF